MSYDEKILSELYPLIKEKDEKALKEFFLIMQPDIFHFLYRFTSDKFTADDLTQEAFVKFYISLDKLDPEQSCKAYLYKIAKNLAVDFLRRKKVITSYNDDEDLLLLYSRNTEHEIDARFFMDDYQKAINSLPERCKATFILSRFSGFSYSEIADILEVSLQTVKNQMNKALAVLRKRLKKHLE